MPECVRYPPVCLLNCQFPALKLQQSPSHVLMFSFSQAAAVMQASADLHGFICKVFKVVVKEINRKSIFMFATIFFNIAHPQRLSWLPKCQSVQFYVG